MQQRRRNARGEGARLRDEIIDAATAILEETGSEDAITLRGVARQANVAAPSIYAHFTDREEIVAAVVARAFGELDASLAEAAEGGLRAICEAYLDFAAERPHRYRVAFGRHHNLPAGEVSAEGQAAFTRLVDACAGNRQTATLIWISLHGYASLAAAVPAFPWPDRPAMLTAILAQT
ncbi:TetR/AcrR family transcriptional regulator [Nonomuraea sp. NPDC050556]|uniref:TetR/AcrR family transcriptional regulator n=1 Tax=Nonomuraea sp. NPDC050556 TaxID=3364369 RepID=UPI00379D8273